MKITNKYNLPQAIVKACERDEHTSADYSVTQLLKGTTEIALEKENKDKLEFDCSDSINLILGKAVHKVFEEKEVDGVLNEFFMATELYDGTTVSGIADQIDQLQEKIKDYKTCSVWKILFKDYKDWREQIRGYLYLWYVMTNQLYLNGQIIALIKDWSPTDAMRNADYPKSPIVVVNFIYTENEILSMIDDWNNKVAKVNDIFQFGDYGCCSDEERWAKPSKFAVVKKGNKKAEKLCNTMDEANVYIGDKKGYIVEFRAGEDTKCLKYCIVGKCGFCPYYNEKYAEKV